jgi:hypothetical protein
MLMLIGDFVSWAVFDLLPALLSRVSKFLLEGRSGESWGGLCFLLSGTCHCHYPITGCAAGDAQKMVIQWI